MLLHSFDTADVLKMTLFYYEGGQRIFGGLNEKKERFFIHLRVTSFSFLFLFSSVPLLCSSSWLFRGLPASVHYCFGSSR